MHLRAERALGKTDGFQDGPLAAAEFDPPHRLPLQAGRIPAHVFTLGSVRGRFPALMPLTEEQINDALHDGEISRLQPRHRFLRNRERDRPARRRRDRADRARDERPATSRRRSKTEAEAALRNVAGVRERESADRHPGAARRQRRGRRGRDENQPGSNTSSPSPAARAASANRPSRPISRSRSSRPARAVGLCDCDIYGPSISLMFGIARTADGDGGQPHHPDRAIRPAS